MNDRSRADILCEAMDSIQPTRCTIPAIWVGRLARRHEARKAFYSLLGWYVPVPQRVEQEAYGDSERGGVRISAAGSLAL